MSRKKLSLKGMQYKVSWFGKENGLDKIMEYVPKNEADCIRKEQELIEAGVKVCDMFIARQNPETGACWYHSYGRWYRIVTTTLATTEIPQHSANRSYKSRRNLDDNFVFDQLLK